LKLFPKEEEIHSLFDSLGFLNLRSKKEHKKKKRQKSSRARADV